MPFRQQPIGTYAGGKTIELFTLTNRNGLEARVSSYGGTLLSLKVPDREGRLDDVVLGFDTIADYLGEHPYFGSLVGRYANRIAHGRFSLDGVVYHLPCNDGPNHLHGGPRGFHAMLWSGRTSESADGAAVTLSRISEDGEQGYPGRLAVEVSYTLTDANELRLDYIASTNKTTIVNLTHHAYFNLAGRGTVLGHVLRIAADRFLPIDQTLIPTGELRPVSGTPFDFTQPMEIGARVNGDDEQLALARGYDHTWVLLKNSSDCAFAGEVHEPESGRLMTILTTQPGVQLYSGNFLDGSVRGKGQAPYVKHAGFCFETQHYPDSPNRPAFPSTMLAPSEVYRETTIYRFGVR